MKTTYSREVNGDPGNHNWSVNFDKSGGYIGITQMQGKECERVLLTPKQVVALFEFVRLANKKK